MKIITTFLLLITLSFSAWAVNKAQAVKIYNNLIVKNNLKNPPILHFGYFRGRDGKIIKHANAQYNGRFIIVNPPMLGVTNEDEIALILGHELGHWKYGHRGSTHQREYEADYQGAVYSRKAGYNVCKGKRYFLRIPQVISPTHPHPRARYNRIPC